MTVDRDDSLEAQLRDGRTLLASIRGTLATLLRQAAEGQGGLKDLLAKHAELETALLKVFQTETRYNDWLAKTTGALADGELDLGALRDDIARKLARLHEPGAAP